MQIANLLTVRDVGEQLKIKVDGVLELIHAGLLSASDVSRPGSQRPRWRISPDALDQFLAARSATPPAKRQPRRRKKIQSITQYF